MTTSNLEELAATHEHQAEIAANLHEMVRTIKQSLATIDDYDFHNNLLEAMQEDLNQ